MNEHISYAMSNEEARNSLVSFNAELIDWSHMMIQCVIIAGFLLAIIHAFKQDKRENSISARLTLLNITLYGITIDTLSYYTVENFWHGEFSMMFLYNRLPLYIICFYPAFMYHCWQLIRRYEFNAVTSSICFGFYSGLLYLIFDNLGPMLGWWIWDTSDPSTWPYVSSVPLTSYHWFFTFSIAFALVNHRISYVWAKDFIAGVKKAKTKVIAGVIAQPVLTILLGSIFFIPYNLFGKFGPPYDMLPWERNLEMATLLHMVTFAAAGWLFLMKWRKPKYRNKGDRDVLLMTFPFMYLVSHAYMYIAKFDLFFGVNAEGLASNGWAVGNMFAVIFAIIGSATILLLSHPPEKES